MEFNTGLEISRKAGVDFSAKQYFLVTIDTSNLVQLANAQTLKIVGIITNAPKANDVARVHLLNGGTSKVIAGGTVAIGDWVTADSSGKGITTVTNKDMVIGVCVKGGAAGETIEVATGLFTLSS